ncbi:hypothetical protein Ae201684P_002827 [Aphanomyces euteiches]|uniref:Uncharacterized protein n=1 Tax=Aphanomyces euteiches TaxID=100861 RepID=A0A6G0X296_9STRA|nr:hypothetical protein Ae201684_009191 [Aphanomyces euteiches]KAH9070469.1 hypothetical protein Ae201684P_002827 [Aphanomyces euteiches]
MHDKTAWNAQSVAVLELVSDPVGSWWSCSLLRDGMAAGTSEIMTSFHDVGYGIHRAAKFMTVLKALIWSRRSLLYEGGKGTLSLVVAPARTTSKTDRPSVVAWTTIPAVPSFGRSFIRTTCGGERKHVRSSTRFQEVRAGMDSLPPPSRRRGTRVPNSRRTTLFTEDLS